jgi:hypothetical protein
MNVISPQFGQHDGEHLSDAELFELYQGRLSPAQFASVQQHLFVCTKCLRAFKDVSDFFTPPQADEPAPSDEQIEAGWNELKERLPLPKAQIQIIAVSSSRRWVLPLAASLLIALGLAGPLVWRAWQTETQLARMVNTPTPAQASPTVELRPAATPPVASEQPQPKAAQVPGSNQAARPPFPVEELLITSGERGAADVAQARKLFVPAQEKNFRLKLRIYNPLNYRSFRVELLDQQQKVVQAVDGKLTKDLAIEAILQRVGLADDKYFLRVTGISKQTGQTEVLESVIEITSRRN